MKTRTAIAFLAIGLGTACAQQASPTKPGVYLQSNGQWVPLSIANPSGTKTGGTGKSMFTAGISKISVSNIYRDASAPIATNDAVPIFYIVGAARAQTRDITIVRLKVKHDHRELKTLTMGAFSGANIEYDPKDIVHVTSSQVDGGETIRPVSPLSPGEYILFAGTGSAGILVPGYCGYDFTVAPKH